MEGVDRGNLSDFASAHHQTLLLSVFCSTCIIIVLLIISIMEIILDSKILTQTQTLHAIFKGKIGSSLGIESELFWVWVLVVLILDKVLTIDI